MHHEHERFFQIAGTALFEYLDAFKQNGNTIAIACALELHLPLSLTVRRFSRRPAGCNAWEADAFEAAAIPRLQQTLRQELFGSSGVAI